jgi:hypothetical protein
VRSITRSAAAVAALASLVAAPDALAATHTVRADSAVARACHTSYLKGAAGTAVVKATATTDGLVHARLSGGGDWDLGVFDAKSGRSVAGSAAPHARELAEGFVRAGQEIAVQACRYAGSAATADVFVSFSPVPRSSAEKKQLVAVKTETAAEKQLLQTLHLDLTEHGDSDSVDVVLHGTRDARALRDAGLTYDVEVADLESQAKSQRTADLKFQTQNAKTHLPSGANAYRRLADYELEMKQLAAAYPDKARLITLAHPTWLGRDVVALEITNDVANTGDGKPIFLNMGVHHAREWPSSEHAMEFAYDVLRNQDRSGALLDDVRLITVPVVNPDGFNISREAQHSGVVWTYSTFDYEMKRKNCRPSGEYVGPWTCLNSSYGAYAGVDPNRNYGGLWGAFGASVVVQDNTYRGPGPFSEPEVENIRVLQSTRQITNLISNHTFSELILRPPGVAATGQAPDEPLLADLGADMAEHNGYANVPGYALYDTSGTTEDWTYWTAGALSYTFEIGNLGFHPPFNNGVVDEYLGRGQATGSGAGGNREAYWSMLSRTALAAEHSVLAAQDLPAGADVKITKTIQNETAPVILEDDGDPVGPAIPFTDTLTYTAKADAAGDLDWHVNPSTRPWIDGRYGREPTGEPQQSPIAMPNPAGIPRENIRYPAGGYESFAFDVLDEGYDNGSLNVHIEWGDANTDWDVYVIGPDGSQVTSSASFGDTDEDAFLNNPAPGTYTVHIVNYDLGETDDWFGGEITFGAPTPPVPPSGVETWTLTCNGRTTQVEVDRGGVEDIDDECAAAARRR